MRERLAKLNVDRVALGLAPLGVKIGVHTGPVVAGTIGAADRHEYTVVGDTVNVAARLEELCRDHGCEVIVSGTAWDLARAAARTCPPPTSMPWRSAAATSASASIASAESGFPR
jgi:adenylate cyclase